MPTSETRRSFLVRFAAAGAAVSLSSVLVACGDSVSTTASACEGYGALTPAEIQVRQTFQYVDQTPVAAQNCANCASYNAPATAGGCGGCKLFAGPVVAAGYCTGWAAQPTA